MINNKKMFWITSYPRSGNTWLRLILCGLFFTENGKINNFHLLNKIPGFDSLTNFRFVKGISKQDYDNIVNEKGYNEKSIIAFSKYWIEAQKKINITQGSFGFFKTHNARVKINNNYYTDKSTTLGFIYCIRDPRDVVISYSKYMNKNIDDTIHFLLDGQIMQKEKINNKMPEIILNWRDHYLSWKKFTDVPSLFIKYENILDNIDVEIRKITEYFKKNFNISINNEDEKITNIIESTKFNNLKKNEQQYGFPGNIHSSFFRKGQKKQWEKTLSVKQIILLEEKFKDQLIEFKYI